MVVDASALCEAPVEEESPTSSDDESSEPDSPPLSEAPNQLGLQLATRSSTQRLDPFEVRFSQMKMRHLFGDGRRVADTVEEVKAVRCSEAEREEYGVEWRLVVPFPHIEVIRWHCKLRDATTGRPQVDPETGEDLIDSEEHWFTLDNRRLYCLQEAASRVWPERCVADVCVIIAGPHSRMRELRKFRTLDLGRSVLIGSRSDGVAFVRWSWRAKVGVLEPGDGENADGDENAAGEKVARPQQGSVLEHLSSLKPDDYERIEISKKLSWVLRRGAKHMEVDVADDGWMKLEDVLKVPFFDGISINRLLQVVEDSNKQKWRYQLKQSPEGMIIRASGRKGVVDEGAEGEHPSDSTPKEHVGAQDLRGAQPIGAAVARGRALGKNGLPRMEGRTTPLVTPEKEEKKEPSRAPAAKAIAAKTVPPPVEKEKSLEELLQEAKINYSGSAPTQKPGKKPAGVPSVPPGNGFDPTLWQNLVVQSMPGAKNTRAAAAAQAKELRPPGVNTAAAAVPPAQFAQQMQAMRQMFAISARYQMQVRGQLQQLMQMRMLQQMQALQAMHAASELRQMRAMQEMQMMYENIQAEWEAADWTGADYAEEAGQEPPELDDDFETRIHQALEAAAERNGTAAHAQQEPEEQQQQKEPSRSQQAVKDPQPADIEAKIAEALGGALKRSGATAVQPPAAKPSATAASPANIEAKIAKAVSAAKERSTAPSTDIQAKVAEALAAAKERSGAAAPAAAASKKPAVGKPPSSASALQAKFAEALEAARSRSEAAKGVA